MRAVTANRLNDGVVVYLTAEGSWSERVEDGAVVAPGAEEKALLAAADRSVAARLVVAPYAIDVDVGATGQVRPVRYRERIRADGPSIHPQFAKAARI